MLCCVVMYTIIYLFVGTITKFFATKATSGGVNEAPNRGGGGVRSYAEICDNMQLLKEEFARARAEGQDGGEDTPERDAPLTPNHAPGGQLAKCLANQASGEEIDEVFINKRVTERRKFASVCNRFEQLKADFYNQCSPPKGGKKRRVSTSSGEEGTKRFRSSTPQSTTGWPLQSTPQSSEVNCGERVDWDEVEEEAQSLIDWEREVQAAKLKVHQREVTVEVHNQYVDDECGVDGRDSSEEADALSNASSLIDDHTPVGGEALYLQPPDMTEEDHMEAVYAPQGDTPQPSPTSTNGWYSGDENTLLYQRDTDTVKELKQLGVVVESIEEFEQYTQEKNLWVRRISTNANGLYKALSISLFGTARKATELRGYTKRQLDDKLQWYVGKCKHLELDPAMEASNAASGGWGNPLDIAALADVLRVVVKVVYQNEVGYKEVTFKPMTTCGFHTSATETCMAEEAVLLLEGACEYHPMVDPTKVWMKAPQKTRVKDSVTSTQEQLKSVVAGPSADVVRFIVRNAFHITPHEQQYYLHPIHKLIKDSTTKKEFVKNRESAVGTAASMLLTHLRDRLDAITVEIGGVRPKVKVSTLKDAVVPHNLAHDIQLLLYNSILVEYNVEGMISSATCMEVCRRTNVFCWAVQEESVVVPQAAELKGTTASLVTIKRFSDLDTARTAPAVGVFNEDLSPPKLGGANPWTELCDHLEKLDVPEPLVVHQGLHENLSKMDVSRENRRFLRGVLTCHNTASATKLASETIVPIFPLPEPYVGTGYPTADARKFFKSHASKDDAAMFEMEEDLCKYQYYVFLKALQEGKSAM